MTIAPGAWREVALSDAEYEQICALLGREPRPVELGMFGAMWSEHCGYKHSRPLLKRLPTEHPGYWKVRAKTPERSMSATSWRSFSKSNRTIIRARSNHIRGPQPESAGSCATSLRWVRGQSRFSTRCDLVPSIKPEIAISLKMWWAALAAMATASASQPSAVRFFLTHPTMAIRSSTPCALA